MGHRTLVPFDIYEYASMGKWSDSNFLLEMIRLEKHIFPLVASSMVLHFEIMGTSSSSNFL